MIQFFKKLVKSWKDINQIIHKKKNKKRKLLIWKNSLSSLSLKIFQISLKIYISKKEMMNNPKYLWTFNI